METAPPMADLSSTSVLEAALTGKSPAQEPLRPELNEVDPFSPAGDPATLARRASIAKISKVPQFGFNFIQNQASLGRVEIADQQLIGTHYTGAVVCGDRHIVGTGPHMSTGSAWQRTARVVTGTDPPLPNWTEQNISKRFPGADPNRVPPHDKSRYFHALSVDDHANKWISDHSQDEPPPTEPTGKPPAKDRWKTEWRWEIALHGMQPGGTAWIGVIERSNLMHPNDLAEANPLGGRRCEHLWMRDIGAAGVYLHRDRQRNEEGRYVVRCQPQQTPSVNGEFEERPKDFAKIKEKFSRDTQTLHFGARETHIAFTAPTCFSAAEEDPATYVRDRPAIGSTALPDGTEAPIRVFVLLHIDERTYPNGTYVDESTVTIKVEDTSIEPPGDPFQTFEMPFRMKKRALLPCVGLSRGVAVELDSGGELPLPRIPKSAEHVAAHWDLGKVQCWRDVQQFELHRRKGNAPKVDVDRSIRFAKHAVVPRKKEQLPPNGLDSLLLGYVRNETQNRSTFVGHITRMEVAPPMYSYPKWGEDVKPLGPAFIPHDVEHMQRVCPYGYIPSLGYTYVTGGRAKHDRSSAARTPETFGVFARSQSMSSLRRLQSPPGESGGASPTRSPARRRMPSVG